MDYDVDYKGLGMRVRLFRQGKGLTQEQLAEKVSVTRNHIAHLESGDNVPSLALTVRIANVLEKSVDELLSDSLDVYMEGARTDILGILEGCSPRKAEMILRCMEAIRDVMSDLEIE